MLPVLLTLTGRTSFDEKDRLQLILITKNLFVTRLLLRQHEIRAAPVHLLAAPLVRRHRAPDPARQAVKRTTNRVHLNRERNNTRRERKRPLP
jgi:hypothetical protein